MKCKNLFSLYYRTSIISLLFNLILFSCLFIGMALVNNKDFYYGVLVTFIILLPFFGYFLYKFIFYRNVKLTDIQEVRLQNVINKKNKKFVGFSITLKIDDTNVKKGIKPIFTTSAGKLCVSNFKDQKVLVGYCRKTKEVVVIDLVEGEE